MKPLLGLSGFKGSGKDSVADFLVEEHGWLKMSFAEPLKDMVAEAFDLPRHLLEGDTEESREWRENHIDDVTGKTPRVLLQEVGVAMRNVHADFWVNQVKAMILRVQSTSYAGIVVPDMRFANEFDMINELEGINVRVKRKSANPAWYDNSWSHITWDFREMSHEWLEFADPSQRVHVSEWLMALPTAQAQMNDNLENDGTIRELETETEKMVNNLFDLHYVSRSE